ncbi:MAG TPA: sulfotransferase [Thermoanaerobaculia bacterium]|nr:sulfotransferase [Thermoanaerobaculia bacterium]
MHNATQHALFLTGMQRSGTTLLAKLLGADPRYSLLSQPFPLLFVEAKRAFLRTLGATDSYPLGHLFLEQRYRSDELPPFLDTWQIAREQLDALFERMDDYSGQYTRFDHEKRNEAFSHVDGEGGFAAIVAELQFLLATSSGATWFGSKETICEEFVPYLLSRGFRCMIILRDPRDIIASLNHGRGHEFGGEVKPTLFNVRNWRKSVAVALAMEEHPRFSVCRYEDLVTNPAQTLARQAEKLRIDPIDEAAFADLRDENGRAWSGNSSHGEHAGISKASAGAYRRVLSPDVAEAIEAACLPELQLLGYETTLTRADAIRVIETFADPYEVRREGMERDRTTPENAKIEAERLHRVTDPPSGESVSWFLFERAHERLRAGFRP